METKQTATPLPESVRNEATRLFVAGARIIDVAKKLNTNYNQVCHLRNRLVKAGILSPLIATSKRMRTRKSKQIAVAAKVRSNERTDMETQYNGNSKVTRLMVNNTRIDIHDAAQVIVMSNGVKVLY